MGNVLQPGNTEQFNQQLEALGLGALVGIMATIMLISLALSAVLYIIDVIASWKLFSKAGRRGWLALIPLVKDCVLFKIVWKRSKFWKLFWYSFIIGLISGVLETGLLLGLPGGEYITIALSVISVIFSIGVAIIGIQLPFKISYAYGHGTLFGLGLLFFPYIFKLILAFGRSEYQYGKPYHYGYEY